MVIKIGDTTYGIGVDANKQPYASPGDLAGLVKPVVKEKGREFAEVSRRMAILLRDKIVYPYASPGVLADDLIKTVSAGQAAQARGAQLEGIAAAHMGGWTPTSRPIADWLKASGVNPTFVKDNGGADPDLKSRTDQVTVKVDAWSANTVGIVGTGGKEKNLQKFVKICRDLNRICGEHGLTPRVYAYASSEGLLKEAAGAVGDANVFTIDDAGKVASYA